MRRAGTRAISTNTPSRKRRHHARDRSQGGRTGRGRTDMRRTFAGLLATLLTALGCQGGLPVEDPALRRAPTYRPGQSIAESRVCECRECFQPKCCGGDVDAESNATDGELGMTLGACSRCVRRVWTVRGSDACETLAPPECCPGSV